MPKKVEQCVESVLEDNPEYSESRAWTICKTQQEATVDVDAATVEAERLDDVDLSADALDTLAEQSAEWTRVETESGDATAWIHADGAAVFETTNAETVAEEASEEFAIDVIQIVQDGDDGPVADGALLALGADMPNAGVYVDWNIDAWPDDEQLKEAHVSDYGSIEDLEQVASGPVEVIETVTPNFSQSGDTEGQSVVVSGLSQEARTDIERRYNVKVQEVTDE